MLSEPVYSNTDSFPKVPSLCPVDVLDAQEISVGNKDADIENGLEDRGRGKGKLGQSERVTLTYIHYQM